MTTQSSCRTLDAENAMFSDHCRQGTLRVHRVMTWMMVGQFLLGLAFALFWSPQTWIGQTPAVHIHVWSALLIGMSLTTVAILWMRWFPTQAHTRHVIAVIQVLWSSLLIHLSGGRVETHFHVFASLALLSMYKDWHILVTATAVVAVDHIVRGIYYPLSVFGIDTQSPWRWMEHAAWLLFEVALLAPSCVMVKKKMRELCESHTELEDVKNSLDGEVALRTEELQNAFDELERTSFEARKLALVAQFSDNAIIITGGDYTVEWVNTAFCRITGYAENEVIGRSVMSFLGSGLEDADDVRALWQAFESRAAVRLELPGQRKDGASYWAEIEVAPVPNDACQDEKYIAVIRDVSERIAIEQEQQRLNQELLDVSRQAGMAEIATGVLHNVGNILNSVNVSASVIQSQLSGSRLSSLEKLAALLQEYENTFPEFVRDDPRGRHIPEYICRVTQALSQEHSQVSQEFEDLMKNIEHIKDVVNVQQSIATCSGLLQELNAKDLIEDALTANKASLCSHKVAIRRDIPEDLPDFVGDKHRILQILINLIKNAKDAVKGASTESPEIVLKAEADAEWITITVADNGMGISPESLDRIFQHGFTTKKNGHGFGLHASANAAKEMGGSLNVFSEGSGKGAQFELRLPLSGKLSDEERVKSAVGNRKSAALQGEPS